MTTVLAIFGLALCVVWLAVGALVGFTARFIGATFLIVALLFALRVDAVTRNILRSRGRPATAILRTSPGTSADVSRLQHDLDAAVLLVAERLVELGTVLERCPMR